jgi:hypothetical protein
MSYQSTFSKYYQDLKTQHPTKTWNKAALSKARNDFSKVFEAKKATGKTASSTKKPKASSTKKPKTSMKKQEEKIDFPRNKIPKESDDEYAHEGYWKHNKEDEAFYPFPIIHKHPFPTQEAFLKRLERIEQMAEENQSNPNFRIQIVGYRGFSSNRIDGSFAGSREYQDKKAKIVWTEGFRQGYVQKYNVVPSKQFYDYVMGI